MRTDSDNERSARRRLKVNNSNDFDDDDEDDEDDEDAPPMLGNRMRAQMRSTQLTTMTAPNKKPFSMEVIDF